MLCFFPTRVLFYFFFANGRLRLIPWIVPSRGGGPVKGYGCAQIPFLDGAAVLFQHRFVLISTFSLSAVFAFFFLFDFRFMPDILAEPTQRGP